MTLVVLAGVLILAIVAGLVALGVRAWRGRDQQGDDGDIDLIPYLLLALAVGVAGFTLVYFVNVQFITAHALVPNALYFGVLGAIAGMRDRARRPRDVGASPPR